MLPEDITPTTLNRVHSESNKKRAGGAFLTGTDMEASSVSSSYKGRFLNWMEPKEFTEDGYPRPRAASSAADSCEGEDNPGDFTQHTHPAHSFVLFASDIMGEDHTGARDSPGHTRPLQAFKASIPTHGVGSSMPYSPVAGLDITLLIDDLSPRESEAGLEAKGKAQIRRTFTQPQLREMIRDHGFSSGFQSYKQFSKRHDSGAVRPSRTTRREPPQLGFLGRSPSAFGVELVTASEREAWDLGVRSMGSRSASEGALLKYAQNAVEEMTRTVKLSLGVDVTKITRKDIRKPSFAARLDIGRVSLDPTNPSSATAQAVRKGLTPRIALPLISAGHMAMNPKGKH